MLLRMLAIVGSPGCYPTATLLALAPLARAGLIEDLVVDAKSGVSGAGREAKADLMFGEVNESVKAYGLGGHRHVAEIEQELAQVAADAGLEPDANPGAIAVDFLPHLIPMTRGILSASHVRPTRDVTQAELDALYATAYADEPFVTVVAEAAGDQARHAAATRSASTSASTSGPGGSSRSAWRTTSSRAPPARRSSPSTSSTGCRRPRASSSGRWPHRPRTPMTVARVSPVPGSPTVLPPVERRGAIPLGFRAGGLAAGIKASGRPDLAVAVTTSGPAAAAAVFTPNTFAAAPVRLSKAHLAATSGDPRGGFGWAEAVISTSGSANAATGAAGDADQRRIAELLADATGVPVEHTLHLSTGIIGTRLPLDKVAAGLAAIMPTLEATDAGLRSRRRSRSGRPIR